MTRNRCLFYPLTGRVGRVTTSAAKSLDALLTCLDTSAKTLDASAKYFRLVGGVLAALAAQGFSPRQGCRFGDTFLNASAYNICRLGM